MERTTFFDHYRLAKEYDGSAVEIARVGPAFVYKAADLRSGAPVALTLLPIENVDPEERERFEEKARAAILLDHINIVRTVEFGRQGDDYAFVSEYPHGETLAAWVADNGPMSADAVLRVALQVVSALSAASFHQINHRGIEPSNIMIVSGQTAEGGWPAIKLMNLPVAGLTGRIQQDVDGAPFASPEQLREGTVDFRSQIYSLGATMCFLLTGAFYSAEPRSLQTRRFAKPLRRLITPMLRQNPDERPQDPVVMAHELRACLERVERRQAWSRRFGIPFAPVATSRRVLKRAPVSKPQSILAAAIERPNPPTPEVAPVVVRPRRIWLRRGLAMAAVLLAAATVAAMLLPAPVGMILHRSAKSEPIGVPVGVAEDSPAPAVQNTAAPVSDQAATRVANSAPHTAMPVPPVPAPSVAMAANNSSSTRPQVVSAPPTPASPAPAIANAAPQNPPIAAATTSAPAASPENSPGREVASNESVSSPPPAPAPAEGPQTVWERVAGKKVQAHVARQAETGAADEKGSDQSADKSNEGAADQSADQSGDSNDNEDARTVAKSRSSKTKSAATANASSRGDSTTTTSRRRSSVTTRQYNSAAQDASGDAPPRYARHRARGSVRAQFAGTTPDGSIILRFPNGQTAIVPPPPGEYVPRNQRRVHRPRHVIIEERSEAPYQPFLPPDA